MDNKKLTHQFQLNKLKNSTEDVIKDKTLSQGFNKTIKGVTENVGNAVQPLTSGDDFVKKIANLRAAKMLGKKAISAVPFVGAAYAAMSGEPAMAAEELAGDIPVVGQAYEAIKPTPTGPAAGSLDARIENGTLTDEDKQQLRMEALKNYGR